MLSFLAPIFQGIVTSAIFELGMAGISSLRNRVTLEKRYKRAFEKAICRYFAEPEYAARSVRGNYSKYLESLKKDLSDVNDLRLENGVYKKLLEYFKEEVCKDPILRAWVNYQLLVTSSEKLSKMQDEQHRVLEELKKVRKEQSVGLACINETLQEILQNVSPCVPELQNVAVLPLQNPFAPDVDLKTLHISSRPKLVEQCVAACKEGKVVILYGGVKIGKSTLAELIRRCQSNVLIYEDIPDVNLDNLVRFSCQKNSRSRATIITTQVPLNTNVSFVDTSRIVQIEVPLLNDEEIAELIDTYSPSRDYTRFIKARTCGHPVLVKTLCSYLSSCNWIVDETVFAKMLNYSFDSQLSRSLAELLQRIIPNPAARSLLNRMMLVKGPFTYEEVVALADVEPKIHEPRTILLTLQPNWVTENSGTFTITPLYDKAWTPDMDSECYKACNSLLASRILTKRLALNELDVLHYLIYAQNAEEYDAAGFMYISALEKIRKEDISKLTILPSIWVDVPMPDQMDVNLRIITRIQQLTTLKDLSKTRRDYILNDLCQMIENMPKCDLTSAYYGMLSSMFLYENNTQAGLKYYNLSIANRDENSLGTKELAEMTDMLEKSLWYFPLRFTSVSEYDGWFERFSLQTVIYNHDDTKVCEYSFLAAYHLVYNVWKDLDKREIVDGLYQLVEKAASNNCPEIAIAMLYEIMETYNKLGQYSDAQGVYNTCYDKFKEYPLAIVLLNGSMAYSLYLDPNIANADVLPYAHLMRDSGYDDVIPYVHLHIRQIEAYVLSESNLEDGLIHMKEAVAYLQKPGHSTTAYEYYRCLGEISYLYWKLGDRKTASEILSECVAYVLSKEGMESPFAKTYLCICDCLLVYFLNEIKGQSLPKEQALPYTGMFTERDPNGLDDLYTVDRIYTSSYMMYDICKLLALEKLRSEWAYKVLEAIQTRGENMSFHFVAMLLVPIFASNHDYDAILRIAQIYSSSLSITYESNHELQRESADAEFVQYTIIPALLAALKTASSGDRGEIERVRTILASYTPVINNDVISEVIAVLDRKDYDVQYTEDLHRLDINKFYPVYVCAYLLTALSVNAFDAFKLIMAVIVNLEKDLVNIFGQDIKYLINDFISSFWRARILTFPEQFVNYELLSNKGMKKIEEYTKQQNGANRIMFVISNHLPKEVNLVRQQEDWLDIS